MGHHYIPQHYLRGFEVSGQPGMIWMYNKTAKTSKCLPIKRKFQRLISANSLSLRGLGGEWRGFGRYL